ncbi:hypothetical protein LPJ59_000732 [Coemansia sp. RSA 2399]|nr:hypothetical protein LPJ59_000732 [Coemansia sp. RSA 2399]
MVFTVGTFDEDDGEYIGRELDSAVTKTPQDQQDRQQNRLEGNDSFLPAEADFVKDDTKVLLRKSVQETPKQAVADLLGNDNLLSETAPAGVAASQQQLSRRQPLFTMGSHSEVSDTDSSDSYAGPLLASQTRGSLNHDASREDMALHPEPASNSNRNPLSDQTKVNAAGGCCVSTSNGYRNECISGLEKDIGERTRSPCALHSCKATTSLSQLHTLPNAEQAAVQDLSPGLSEMASAPFVRRERVVSAPPARRNGDSSARGDNTSSSDVMDDARDTSEPQHHSKGKMVAARDAHLKPRKKVASKKTLAKRTTSTAALRTRTRPGGGGHRRDYPLAKPLLSTVGAASEGQADGSYVDYSGNSSFGDDADRKQKADGPQQQTGSGSLPVTDSHAMAATNSNVPDQSRASLNSSTETLGVSAGQEVDDSATTASIDSPHQEHIAEPLDTYEGASENGDAHQQQQTQIEHTSSRITDPASPKVLLSTTMAAETSHSAELRRDSANMRHSQSSAYGLFDAPSDNNVGDRSHTDSADALHKHDTGARRRGKQVRGRSPDHAQFQGQSSSRMSDEQAANTSSSQTAYISKSSKRNIESQRQQGIVEKEEEDMDIANSQLTGVPRRCNRPAGMAPYVFLLPDLPAYGQQVRRTDRLYASSRTMAHPLLESMVRCAELREQRIASSASRGNSRPWVSRRMLTEPSESDSQTEWWDSLMPPPPSSAPHKEQRGASRMQSAELPSWMVEPDDAKRTVYGSDMDPLSAHGHNDLADPSCPHIRELRSRAKELRISRQHNATAGRNNALSSIRVLASTSDAALETWRGRRIPGLLNVDVYTGAIGPLDSGTRQNGNWLGSETPFSSSPESTTISMPRGNHLAPPYRRYGTVYGYTAANTTNSRAGGNANVPGALGGGGGSGGAQASLRSNSRGHESMPSSRPGTAGIWENDPRRSSYFDRISVDELRPNVASSSVATQTTPAGLLRRVISGLTGGATAAFGTSQ